MTASQLVRCGHSGKKSNLRLEQSYLVSDDNGLIRTLPNKITLIEDSVFRFLVPPDKFLEYNIKTKKLNVLLDKIDFNIDSLISITYQPLNIHKYRYYHHSDKDLKNYDHNLFVLSNFSFYNNHYYIPVSLKALAENVFDDVLNSKNKRKIDSIKALYGNNKVNSLESLSYMLVTDKDFKQTNIFPFDLKNKEGNVTKTKGSYYYAGNYYFPLHSKKVVCPSDSMSLKGMEPDYYFRAYSVSENNITAGKLLVEKSLIHSEEYNWSRHLMQRISYFESDQGLLASMGKEIINLTANKLFSIQPVLESDEYVSNFSLKDNYLIYTTEKFEKPGLGTKTYGYVNSLSSCNIKMLDIKSNKMLINEPLKSEGMYLISPSNFLYEYDENKDSVEINKYSLHADE